MCGMFLSLLLGSLTDATCISHFTTALSQFAFLLQAEGWFPLQKIVFEF